MTKKYLLIGVLLFLFAGCSAGEIQSFTTAALSKDPSSTFKVLATSKAIGYSANPDKLKSDIKKIANLDKVIKEFINSISKEWGEENVEIPKQKEYVKYIDNYKSRALIDFDKGIITVETLTEENPKKSLENAIITTLLLPDDPRAVDLFGSSEVKLGGTPYLLGEVKDDQNKEIRHEWRAKRYANFLLENNYKQKTISNDGKTQKVSYVTIPMIKGHAGIRVTKFKPYVQKYAKKFNVSENLVYAIIQTESNFNQFAVSSAGAIGLMQVVPTSAGKDAYKHAKGKTSTPTKEYLFNPSNNIELGSAYIQILNEKYLEAILNPISREYCVISAYNTGSGNVFKAFSSNRSTAANIINQKKPSEVYEILRNKLPYEETRRYLLKVVNYKKDFINI
ncbi:MAG: murein transglycosylase domain-containing protein [Arcobacteraceae bacterium]